MKKRILCIALAVLLVGTAIGFAIYNSVGTTFNYASGDMADYLNFTDKDVLAAWDAVKGDTEAWKEATEADMAYAIAKALKAVNEKSKDTVTSGKLDKYDYLTMGYMIYLTEGEGEGATTITVADPNKMNILTASALTKLQLNEDEEFSKMLTAALLGKDFVEFKTFTEGQVYADDTMWVTFDVTKDNKTTSYKYEKVTLDDLDDYCAGLKDQFLLKQDRVVEGTAKDKLPEIIGEELSFTIDDTTVKMTIHYVSRTVLTEGTLKDGDTMYFTYVKKGEKDPVPMVLVNSDASKEAFDAKFTDLAKTDFFAKMRALTEIKNTTIKVTVPATEEGKEPTEVEYEIAFDYVMPADPENDDRETLIKKDAYVELKDIKYPTDSKAVQIGADGKEVKVDDKSVSLADKTVTVHVYMVNYVDAGYGDFETLYTDLAKTSFTDEAELSDYLKAYDAYLTAEEKKKDDNDADYKKAVEALVEAEKKYCTKKSITDTTADKHDKDVAEKAIAEAYKLYEKETLDAKQAEFSMDRRYSIAEALWNKLVAVAANKMIEYPSKALSLVETGLIDSHEKTFYEDEDGAFKVGSNSVTPDDFDDYLDRVAYASRGEGVTVEAAIEKEVKQIVLENVLLYRLVEIYNITMTEDQTSTLETLEDNVNTGLYGDFEVGAPAPYYFIPSYTVKSRSSYLFDNLMEKLTEQFDANVKKTEATEPKA